MHNYIKYIINILINICKKNLKFLYQYTYKSVRKFTWSLGNYNTCYIIKSVLTDYIYMSLSTENLQLTFQTLSMNITIRAI